jgi:ABC-type multidrug transport system ATPase subunit
MFEVFINCNFWQENISSREAWFYHFSLFPCLSAISITLWTSLWCVNSSSHVCNKFSGIFWKGKYLILVSFQELKQQGIVEDRLQLLVNVTGAFRPGVLTALVGVSGAGKTTLMDVLAGRKTGGIIEGNMHISGYPKKQETFARVSGYCEQNDIHSPCLTVLESLLFSAWLRLPTVVNMDTQQVIINIFVLFDVFGKT